MNGVPNLIQLTLALFLQSCSKRFSHWRTLGSIPEFVNQMNQKRTLASISERPEMKSRNLDTDELTSHDVDLLTPSISKYQPQIIRETLKRDAMMQVSYRPKLTI